MDFYLFLSTGLLIFYPILNTIFGLREPKDTEVMFGPPISPSRIGYFLKFWVVTIIFSILPIFTLGIYLGSVSYNLDNILGHSLGKIIGYLIVITIFMIINSFYIIRKKIDLYFYFKNPGKYLGHKE